MKEENTDVIYVKGIKNTESITILLDVLSEDITAGNIGTTDGGVTMIVGDIQDGRIM